ncbi:MAG: 4-hydroxybutyryl-CoA dehydratase [Chloroflexi bacterium]|nr:4-hydroxybutyryl-CoA dehydratase [Chloroflexota bacterium]
MGLRTVAEYKESLRDGREVYVLGERVEDVTTHPILSITTDHAANVYEVAQRPELRELFTFTSPETGQPVNRHFMQPRDARELALRGQVIEEHTRQGNSTLNLLKSVGTDALCALTIVAPQIDADRGTEYTGRVARFLSHCRENDLSIALAQTDVKGDRAKRPHQQADPDLYVRIVERRSDGIVVRGAKAHITAVPAANELIVIPTRAMGKEDADYAVAFAIPLNTPGLKLICRPTRSTAESLFDNPISRRNIETEALTVFDDVFVPWERVFLAGDWQHAGTVATMFATFHRFTGVSYKPPIADMFVGAAQLIAEANGLDGVSHVREKIARLIHYAEIIRACGKAAANECEVIEPGIAVPNPVYTNAGKYHFASQFHDAVRLLQDLAGGMTITAPAEADLLNPATRPYVQKYLAGRADVPSVDRLRLFHLIRDLTASEFGGYNLVVTLHGEGPLQAQLIATYREYDLERPKELVRQALRMETPATAG